jgi:hypothetical protein
VINFENEAGCLPLGSANNFQELLRAMRKHILSSKSTRSFYIAMAEQFYTSLDANLQKVNTIPTDDDFKKYVKFEWPTIKTVIRRNDKIVWGYVRKGQGTPHTIHILSDIVASAERAVSTQILAAILKFASM